MVLVTAYFGPVGVWLSRSFCLGGLEVVAP